MTDIYEDTSKNHQPAYGATGLTQFLKRIRTRSKSPSARAEKPKCPSKPLHEMGFSKSKDDVNLSAKQSITSDMTPKTSRNTFGTLIARLSGRRGKRSRGDGTLNGTALSEEDLVSKSLKSDIDNGVSPLISQSQQIPRTGDGAMEESLTSYYSQESVFDSPHRLPSYVRVSCAVSGYAHFARSHAPNTLRYGQPSPITRPPLGQSIVERRRLTFETARSPTSMIVTPPTRDVTAELVDVSPLVDLTDYSSQAINSTPIGQLIAGFDRLHLANAAAEDSVERSRKESNEGGKKRPVPPPKPPILLSDRPLSPIASEELLTSSATTATCITGPLTTSTQDGSSLLEDVLKAIEASTDNSEKNKLEIDSHFECELLQEMPQITVNDSDGLYYQREASQRRKKLQSKCDQCAQDIENELPEHAMDCIRLATGKAGLLLKKKLAKFEELVEKNLKPVEGDSQPVKTADLEGYWAMMEMDFEDIDACFDNIDKLRRNHWQPIPTNECNGVDKDDSAKKAINNRMDPMSRSQIKTVHSPPNSDISEAKDCERRQLLAEAKRRSKQRMGHSDDVQIIFH